MLFNNNLIKGVEVEYIAEESKLKDQVKVKVLAISEDGKISLSIKRAMEEKKPEAKEALNRFKMEAANEVGVNLKQGYNGDLTSKQAGSIGGQMVKKMVESYENNLKTNG